MSPFTSGEIAVMQILWEHGELKPSEVQERFPESIKNPALRSYLSILVEKGHVSRRKKGKAYYYKAVTKRQKAFRTTVRELANAYCEGSAKNLVLNLIRSEKLSKSELLELKRLADDGKRTQPGSQK